MSLESVFGVLDKAMRGKTQEIDRSVLRDPEIRGILTAYFAEQDARPELIRDIAVPQLVHQYLELPLEDRLKLDIFSASHPEYLQGGGHYNQCQPLSKESRTLVKNVRGVKQMLTLFEHFLKHRKEGKVFVNGFDTIFRKGHMPSCPGVNAASLRLQFYKLLPLATYSRPEIEDYTTAKGITLIDGPKQILRILDLYLEAREEGEKFNAHWISKNKKSIAKFGSVGRGLERRASKYYGEEGGLIKIVTLAAKERPEILEHFDTREPKRSIHLEDMAVEVAEFFDFFLRSASGDEMFNGHYLVTDPEFTKKFKTRGKNLCERVRKYLPGGFETLVRRVGEQRPEIYDFWKKTERVTSTIESTVDKLVTAFDFYLSHPHEGVSFSPGYLTENEELKKAHGKIGFQVYKYARRHFGKDNGLDGLVKLAAEKKPEILEHWQAVKYRKFNLGSIVKEMTQYADFFLDNHDEGDLFSADYLVSNAQFISRFGESGRRLLDHLKNRMVRKKPMATVMRSVAERRPDIVNFLPRAVTMYWDSAPKNVNSWKQTQFNMERAVRECVDFFDQYRLSEHSDPFQPFDRSYISSKDRTGRNLCVKSQEKFRDQGGFDYVLICAAKERPEILDYNTPSGILKIEGPKQLLKMFDFYFENSWNVDFNKRYLTFDKKLKEEFGDFGRSLIRRCDKYLANEGGLAFVVELAAKQRPEILDYWSYQRDMNSRGVNES